MAGKQSAELERKKFFADPIMVSTIVVLIVFLLLFILYPLLMLLIDSFMSDGKITLDVFRRVLSLERFRKAFTNTLVLGFIVGICSTWRSSSDLSPCFRSSLRRSCFHSP